MKKLFLLLLISGTVLAETSTESVKYNQCIEESNNAQAIVTLKNQGISKEKLIQIVKNYEKEKPESKEIMSGVLFRIDYIYEKDLKVPMTARTFFLNSCKEKLMMRWK